MSRKFFILEEAEHFVEGRDVREEENLLLALLKSLPYHNARDIANKAGYDLERQ